MCLSKPTSCRYFACLTAVGKRLHIMSQNCRTPAFGGKHPVAARRTLRAIAAFEALKGLAALVVIVGVVDLLHHDVRHLVAALIGHFHLAPDGHYTSLLLHYADLLPGTNLHALILLGAGYTALRWIEAWGLWFDKAWAEWLAALSGAIYIPFELGHCLHRCTPISVGVLTINLGIVIFMSYRLWRRRQARQAEHQLALRAGVDISRGEAKRLL